MLAMAWLMAPATLEKAAKRFGLPLLGSLPLDAAIPPGGDSGDPIVVAQPDGAVSKAFAEIAKATHARVEEMEASGRAAQVDIRWSGA